MLCAKNTLRHGIFCREDLNDHNCVTRVWARTSERVNTHKKEFVLRGVPPSTQTAEPRTRDRADHRSRRCRRAQRQRRERRTESEAQQGPGQVQGRQAVRGGRAGHREVQRRQGEAAEAPEGDIHDPGQRRAGSGRPQQAARRPGFAGDRPVPRRRHRPLGPALPLLQPGRLPRQGVHPRPAERPAGRRAAQDPGQAARTRPGALRGHREAQGPLGHPHRTGQQEEGSPGQAGRGPEDPQQPHRQGEGGPGRAAAARRPLLQPAREPRRRPARLRPGRGRLRRRPGPDRQAVRLRRHRPLLLRLLGSDLLRLRAGRRLHPAHLGGAGHHRHPDLQPERPQGRRPGVLLRRHPPRRPVRGQRPGAARPAHRCRGALRGDVRHAVPVRRAGLRPAANLTREPERANPWDEG
ncbi:hypothetical protein SGPA1_31174 [Streptomyces misionensis JCM 4497]